MQSFVARQTGVLPKQEVMEEPLNGKTGNLPVLVVSKSPLPVTGKLIMPVQGEGGEQGGDPDSESEEFLLDVADRVIISQQREEVKRFIIEICEQHYSQAVQTANSESEVIDHIFSHIIESFFVNGDHIFTGLANKEIYLKMHWIITTLVEYLHLVKGIDRYKLKAYISLFQIYTDLMIKDGAEFDARKVSIIKAAMSFIPEVFSYLKDFESDFIDRFLEDFFPLLGAIGRLADETFAVTVENRDLEKALIPFCQKHLRINVLEFRRILYQIHTLFNKHVIEIKAGVWNEDANYLLEILMGTVGSDVITNSMDSLDRSLVRKIRLRQLPSINNKFGGVPHLYAEPQAEILQEERDYSIHKVSQQATSLLKRYNISDDLLKDLDTLSADEAECDLIFNRLITQNRNKNSALYLNLINDEPFLCLDMHGFMDYMFMILDATIHEYIHNLEVKGVPVQDTVIINLIERFNVILEELLKRYLAPEEYQRYLESLMRRKRLFTKGELVANIKPTVIRRYADTLLDRNYLRKHLHIITTQPEELSTSSEIQDIETFLIRKLVYFVNSGIHTTTGINSNFYINDLSEFKEILEIDEFRDEIRNLVAHVLGSITSSIYTLKRRINFNKEVVDTLAALLISLINESEEFKSAAKVFFNDRNYIGDDLERLIKDFINNTVFAEA